MGILTGPDDQVLRVWCDNRACPTMLAVIAQDPLHPSLVAEHGPPGTTGAIRYNLNQNGWASFPDDRQISEHGLDYCPRCMPRLN